MDMKNIIAAVLVTASVGVSANENCTLELKLQAQRAADFIAQHESRPLPVCPKDSTFKCEDPDKADEISKQYYQEKRRWLTQYESVCGSLKN